MAYQPNFDWKYEGRVVFARPLLSWVGKIIHGLQKRVNKPPPRARTWMHPAFVWKGLRGRRGGGCFHLTAAQIYALLTAAQNYVMASMIVMASAAYTKKKKGMMLSDVSRLHMSTVH